MPTDEPCRPPSGGSAVQRGRRDCTYDGHQYQLLRSERVENGWHRYVLRDTFYCTHCLKYQTEEHPIEER